MRRKLFIGLFLAAAVSLIAGDYLINRSGAQDAGKKSDEKASDGKQLDDILKKDLEAQRLLEAAKLRDRGKREAAPVVQIPPPKLNDAKPAELPTLPSFGAQTNPPPSPVAPPPLLTTPQALPPLAKDPVKPAVLEFPPMKPLAPAVDDAKSVPPSKVPTQAGTPQSGDVKPPPVAPPPSPFAGPPNEPKFVPLQTDKPGVPPPSGGKAGTLEAPPSIPPHASPMPAIAAEVAKLKNCPWSLQIDMVDGQTVVTATVNKKHEFKIVCQSLDLQTGKGTLRASGKVQITGDALTGSCDHLAIPLLEDRLVLEGGAAVSIQKTSSNVSDANPAAFELKGDNLNLRISELESSKFLQTSWSRSSIDSNVRQAAAAEPALGDKRWTPYGTLKRAHRKRLQTEEIVLWQLEGRAGKVIAVLVAREGGSLAQFEGQSISVLGAREQLEGESVLRVTHIALP